MWNRSLVVRPEFATGRFYGVKWFVCSRHVIKAYTYVRCPFFANVIIILLTLPYAHTWSKKRLFKELKTTQWSNVGEKPSKKIDW